MRRFKTAALLVAALVAGMGTSALAAPGDAPAGWTLVGSDTVRYFIPGSTPPAAADVADATSATQITNQNPSSGEWLLVGSENVKDFFPDTDGSGSDQLTASTFVNSRNEEKVYSAGRHKLEGEPTYDAAVRQTDTKTWRLTSQTATVRRYDVPVTRNVHTPYRIVDRFGYDTRKVDSYDNTYRANKVVNTALGQEVVDTHSYTKREEKASAWVRGAIAPSLDQLISTGVDDTVETTYQSYVVDLLAGKISESSKTQGAKSSTFLSDSGSGNTKTALSGSQKRVAFKADSAVASTAKKVEEGGSIKDPSLGRSDRADSTAKDAKQKADEAAREAARKAEEAAKKAEEAEKKANDAAREAAKKAEEAAKEAAKKAEEAAKEAAKKADEAAREAAKLAERDSADQKFTVKDWAGTFEAGDQRVVISASGSKPRATLFKRQGKAWSQVAQDTSPPSGKLSSTGSSYNDDPASNGSGKAFYTGGNIVLKRKGDGSLALSGTYKGKWGTFGFEKLKKL